MNKILALAFCVLASSMLVAFAEPMEYRANQRVRGLDKQRQQQQPAQNPESENIEVTTQNDGKKPPLPSSEDKNEKQQAEEVEEPQSKSKPTANSQENTNEVPFVPVGWKPAGNLLILPPGVFWVAPQSTTPAVETTTTEADESTTTEADAESTTTTEECETESATTETTENNRSGRVETTSEPDAESVEGASDAPEVPQVPENQQPPAVNAVNTFFVQLPDGTLQRVVLLNTNNDNNNIAFAGNYATVPFPAALRAQPVAQAPQPFAFGSAYAGPQSFSYSAQYQVHGK